MNLLGTRAWMWINGICLIIIGIVSLIPAIGGLIPVDILSYLKFIVATITLIVSFKETDMAMINGKIWLMIMGLILFFMGLYPFFPASLGTMADAANLLNTFKVVLGVFTFFIIIIDWPTYGTSN